MLTLSTFTRLFAVAMAGIGLLQLIFRQVLIGRPAAIITNPPVVTAIAVLSALALVVCALQLWREYPKRGLFLATSLFILLFSGLSNLFIIISQADFGFSLTSFGKAITLGSALLLFSNLTATGSPTWSFNLSRLCLGLFLIIGGVQHFLFADFVKFLVPRWIPFELFLTYAAGVALITSGLSLVGNVKINWIGLAAGWMVFVWFLILHVPRAIAEPNANELTAVCESLAVSMVLFALSRIAQDRNP
ncbi:MAG TPA: hypothetical protein VK658_18120 [Chryseolinea sp.]|nr:hypothetical protein [Chryseolinea sp.]